MQKVSKTVVSNRTILSFNASEDIHVNRFVQYDAHCSLLHELPCVHRHEHHWAGAYYY